MPELLWFRRMSLDTGLRLKGRWRLFAWSARRVGISTNLAALSETHFAVYRTSLRNLYESFAQQTVINRPQEYAWVTS
jgi:hypothetical protein